MTEERAPFRTDVAGIWGYWPPAPQLWSYSSLKEIEACPRRWMLSRADYPGLWSQRGYPAVPVVAAIFGTVVHAVVERLTREFGDAGITSPTAPGAGGVLRVLGGWRGIVLEAIEHQVSRFEGNPRVSSEWLDRTRDALVRRAPEAADQVKVFLGRSGLPAAKRAAGPAALGSAEGRALRERVSRRMLAEQEVTAEDLRLTGRIDFLQIDHVDITITDFKTGEEDEGHYDQVRLYALLWACDRAANPDGRRATQLRVAYPAYERSVRAPDEEQLRNPEHEFEARIAEADSVTRLGSN